MTTLGIISAVTAFINLMLASSIAIHGRRSAEELAYVAITVSASIGVFGIVFISGNFVLPFTVFESFALITYLVGGSVYLSFLWFAAYYPPRVYKSLLPYAIVTAAYFSLALTVILVPSLLFDSLRPGELLSERLVFNQPAHIIYTFLLIVAFLWGEFILFRKYPQVSSEEKGIYRNLIGWTLFPGALGIVLVMILPGFGNFSLFPWGPILAVLPFFVMSFYIVVKYRFFNLKVIAAELLTFAIWIFVFINFLSETGESARLVNGLLLLLVVAFGIFLVRSVLRETKQKEQLEALNAELKDLNEHLEQRVEEQTREIKRAYEVEKKARVELEELDKSKDQFILTTQHHLRTPLTIIKGYVEALLGMPAGRTIGESKEHITKAVDATKRLSSLINELLNVSEMQVKQSILNKEPTDVKKVVEEVMSEIRPEIDKKKLKVLIDISNAIIVNVDTIKFREALANVIDNAVKYNNEGGSIVVRAKKNIHPIEKDKQILRISVEDTGIGIDIDEMPKLFAHYFERGEEARKVYATGRGIGLAVTRNIVSAHGGRIWAESAGRGKGSKFFIEIPV